MGENASPTRERGDAGADGGEHRPMGTGIVARAESWRWVDHRGDRIMKFARITFLVAGVWGIVVLTPLFWLVDVTGRRYTVPADYPHFFYGFLSVAMAWQIAFLIIGSNPARFRPLMIPGLVEKLGYVVILTVLYARGQIPALDAQAGVPDFVLCILFLVAFWKTRPGGAP
jgi:hypothetical protein